MQVGDPKHQKEVFDERLEEVSPQVSGFFEIFVSSFRLENCLLEERLIRQLETKI